MTITVPYLAAVLRCALCSWTNLYHFKGLSGLHWWIYISAGRDLKYVLTFSHFSPIAKVRASGTSQNKVFLGTNFRQWGWGQGGQCHSIAKFREESHGSINWQVTWDLILLCSQQLFITSSPNLWIQTYLLPSVTSHTTDSRTTYALEVKHIYKHCMTVVITFFFTVFKII